MPVKNPGCSLAACLVVLLATTFNDVLAFVNGNVTTLSPSSVIAAEGLITVAAGVIIVRYLRPSMVPWLQVVLFFGFVAVVRSAAMGTLELKTFRDVLIIPVFVMLGMTVDRRSLTRVVLVVHALVLVFLAVEWVDTDLFSSFFHVRDYYIATRGYVEADFGMSMSELYISAERPEERVFKFVQVHRLSSLFLEPVSLGNYCVIVFAFLAATWRFLRTWELIFLLVGYAIILIGCDGRLAIAASVLIVPLAFIAPRLPPRSAVFYLPLALVISWFAVTLLNLRSGNDDVTGRLTYTLELLSRLSSADLLGISTSLLAQSVDSGVTYLIVTQSIFGLIAFWVVISVFSSEKTKSQTVYVHAISIYLTLNLMVSYAFISIKTAGLMWFIYGCLNNATDAAVLPIRVRTRLNTVTLA